MAKAKAKKTMRKKTMKNRPKRPLSGYILFMKKHFKETQLKDAREVMKEGARKWKELSKEEKTKFKFQCQQDQSRYRCEMEEYSKFVESSKCPRNSYICFLQDYYLNTFGGIDTRSSQAFTSNSRGAAGLWHNLNSSKKGEYKEKFVKSYATAMKFRKSNANFGLSNDRDLKRKMSKRKSR